MLEQTIQLKNTFWFCIRILTFPDSIQMSIINYFSNKT